MVYESDFYTTRRPYRTTPSLSTYTVSSLPSRQIRILPGLGKVHIVHTYDRIVPYVGHKRLTVVTTPPTVYRVRPSVLYREYDRIERKVRPFVYYSATNHYLNSDSAVRMIYVRNPYTGTRFYTVSRPITLSASRYLDLVRHEYNPLYGYRYYRNYYPSSTWYDYLNTLYSGYKYDTLYRPYVRIFDDETRAIRAETASLLKRIHYPVPRVRKPIITSYSRYEDLSSVPVKFYNENNIYKLITSSTNPRSGYTTYYTEPVKKFIGQGHLSCVSYGGDRVYGRRRPFYTYEDPVKNDIQLLSYYINKFRMEKNLAPREQKVPLSSARPSRIFSSVPKPISIPDTDTPELKEIRAAREARLANITASAPVSTGEDPVKKAQKKKEEARLAEEKALAEEAAKKQAQAKKGEAARKAELARQEELAAQAAAERAAELERRAEQARQEELAKQAAIERAREEEEERGRLEEERRLEEEARAEEERQQLLRLEEIARQAEEEREAELARQAEELAELARQEAELAEQAKKEEEEAEIARRQAEEEELARQEAELAELERQEAELAELARQEAELAEKAREEAEAAKQAAELAAQEEAEAAERERLAEIERQEEELAELERQQAELDALEAEARALLEPTETAAEDPEVESDKAEAEGPQTDEDIPAEDTLPEETPTAEPAVEEPDDEEEE